jgi:hypothetical protein
MRTNNRIFCRSWSEGTSSEKHFRFGKTVAWGLICDYWWEKLKKNFYRKECEGHKEG